MCGRIASRDSIEIDGPAVDNKEESSSARESDPEAEKELLNADYWPWNQTFMSEFATYI